MAIEALELPLLVFVRIMLDTILYSSSENGIDVDIAALSEQLIAVIGTVFVILTLLGIVVDPTTDGMNDPDEKK